MVPPNNLGPDLARKPVNETSHRGMIRSLMYLTATRPDIQLSTVLCFDIKGYSDSDYIGCNMDRKSTSAKAEYVAAAGCCASILWMKSQLSDYNIHYKMIPIFCDNTSAIAISNNPILHSRTKHIDIRYHFIRDHILKGDIKLHFIRTEYQLVDIFTKPLDEPTFTILKAELGMLNIDYSLSLFNHVHTTVAYDPFPSTDETEQRLFREFLIKFSVLNGQRPLTLDFNTFCSSTGLDYNNGKYVAHLTPMAVKKELGKIAINLSYLDKTPFLKISILVAWRILFTFVIQVQRIERKAKTEDMSSIHLLRVLSPHIHVSTTWLATSDDTSASGSHLLTWQLTRGRPDPDLTHALTRPGPQPDHTWPKTRLMTSGQPPLIGGPAVVDQWFSGVFDDGDGIVPTPRGTTQVVTRGKLIVIITSLDRWQVRIRDLIESALNSKLLLINLNSQRLNKEEQEVKNIAEPAAKRQTRITSCLQNFKVISKESNIPLNKTPQISLVNAIIHDLPIEEPEDSLIMGNEELSTIPKKESDKFIKSIFFTNIESKDSYVSNLDDSALLVTPLSDANKDECFDPGGVIDEIDAFLDMDISRIFENVYHDFRGR
ncbi:hypothetical protein Tco_0585361 [Tanacetum coccineum]